MVLFVLKYQDVFVKCMPRNACMLSSCCAYALFVRVSSQLRFQRAHILMTLERWDEALSELQIVAQLAPKEPPVHALLGQVYQRLGLVQESLLHLNIALDLDPKEANAIKVCTFYMCVVAMDTLVPHAHKPSCEEYEYIVGVHAYGLVLTCFLVCFRDCHTSLFICQ